VAELLGSRLLAAAAQSEGGSASITFPLVMLSLNNK
jgi:hypothetical protein